MQLQPERNSRPRARRVESLAQAAAGSWVGPLRSAYGLHLVFVTAVEPAALPPFEAVRPAVEREWFAEHRAAAQTAQYQALRARYQVTVHNA
jgi:parvulin-like peptidyl-prolyl isomerase